MARYLRAVVEVIAEGLLTEDFIIVTVHLLFIVIKIGFG